MKAALFWPCCLLLGVATLSAAAQEPNWQLRRQALIDEIRADVRDTDDYTGVRALDARVMSAMNTVARHEFVLTSYIDAAYENRPLPIGYGQTISQPYIVALMTDLLKPQPDHIVLEIGTGSGYQAAVLAELVKHVYTIEIVEELSRAATVRLKQLNYHNITVKHADGYYGWPEHGLFDGIIVTAVGAQIPPPLVRQLKPGGRMILPVGGGFTPQYLVLVTKDEDGHVSTEQLLPVMFVPLTREH